MEKEIYPDFVARSGQINTPPGSLDTVKEWIKESFIDRSSNVLEVGCITGFISYQIHTYTGANVRGVDISDKSIKKAQKNCEGIQDIVFEVADAIKLPFRTQSFSHVIIGGHLPWVPRELRKSHVRESLRVLNEGGFLLTSLYYFHKRPNDSFTKRLNSCFNTQLTPEDDYETWSNLFDFDDLTIEYEAQYKIFPPDDLRRKRYCERLPSAFQNEWNKKIDLFCENARYINFFVRVMRKTNQNNPYLQIPGGGIYTWREL